MGKKGYTCLFENQLSMVSTSLNNPSQLSVTVQSWIFLFIYFCAVCECNPFARSKPKLKQFMTYPK